jgi:hypothetical protein
MLGKCNLKNKLFLIIIYHVTLNDNTVLSMYI